jgi:hypothetical protein
MQFLLAWFVGVLEILVPGQSKTSGQVPKGESKAYRAPGAS